VTRLLDMGIEPFLVASSLIGVLAQRLVRVLCPRCREAFRPNAEELREVGLTPEKAGSVTLYKAAGCDLCLRGYMGRAGVFELLTVDDDIAQQILDKDSSNEIKQTAVRKGMRTLLSDGRLKVLDGVTTIEELVRVCQRDEI